MSRILHVVNMGLRYGRLKGVRESRQEEPPLGNLAAPCYLEENASHHLCFYNFWRKTNNRITSTNTAKHKKSERITGVTGSPPGDRGPPDCLEGVPPVCVPGPPLIYHISAPC